MPSASGVESRKQPLWSTSELRGSRRRQTPWSAATGAARPSALAIAWRCSVRDTPGRVLPDTTIRPSAPSREAISAERRTPATNSSCVAGSTSLAAGSETKPVTRTPVSRSADLIASTFRSPRFQNSMRSRPASAAARMRSGNGRPPSAKSHSMHAESLIRIAQDALHQPIRRLVDQRVRLGGAVDRELVREQRLEVELGEEQADHLLPPRRVPKWTQVGIDRSHLRRDDPRPVVMELTREVEAFKRPAVPAHRDHAPAETHRPDRLVQRRRRAGDFDHDVRSAVVGRGTDALGDAVGRVEDEIGPQPAREVATRPHPVDPDDQAGARAADELRDEETDHAQP